MTDLIGMDVGRYHIVEQLGEGGMATVYKAYDTRLEREVAIKFIRTDQFAPAMLETILKRFDREAKALAKLSHSNIVGVIDYGEYNGAPYLVMEYLPGGTLKQRIVKPIPWQEAVRTLLPMARALDFAHRQGMIHRDVKASNILITADGDPMLTDFGIAKILDVEEGQTLTGTGMGVGTPEYMAPEQWVGKVTAQSDIYSLGVVFYEMLTGRKPYSADTPAAILIKQTNNPMPLPSQYIPNLPDAVEKVLFKALAKQPEDRYSTMGAFANALDDLLHVVSSQSTQVQKTTTELPPESSRTLIRSDDQIALAKPPQPAEPVRPAVSNVPIVPSVPADPQKPKRTIPRRLWIIILAIVGVIVLCIIGGLVLGKAITLFKPNTPTYTSTPIKTLIPTSILAWTSTFTPIKTATPFMTPTIEEAPTYFTEEFNGSIPNWSHFLRSGDEKKMKLSTDNGKLVFNLTGEDLYAYLMYDPQNYQNVRIDVSADNRGLNENNVSLICRYSKTEGWYEFSVANDGLWWVYVYDILTGGQYQLLNNGGSTAIKSGKAINEYTAICNGTTLSLYINGVKTISFEEKRYALREGLVGIGVSSFKVLPIIVEFDWVTISQP